MRDLAKELDEWGEWPPAWKPAPGEVLLGRVLRYSVGAGQYGPVRTCLLEKGDGSRVSVWLSSCVLLSLFERERPRVGERIGLKFLGRHETKGYKKFGLIVDREEQEPDFSPLGGEKEPDPFGVEEKDGLPLMAAASAGGKGRA